MDINALSRGPSASHAPAPAIPVDHAAENRQVVQAVKAVNGTEMFGQENELLFQKDPQSHRMIVRIVNKRTKEVMSQVPSESVLRLAEDLKHSG
jgi:flagellar protein FlaG